ncbi:hypothetical protein ACJ4V0_04305 [Phreatobacter sp. HK31-P]
MSMPDPRRDFRRKEFDVFAAELGRTLLIWNDLHLSIGGIFWALTKIPNALIPGAIWHALKVDRAQRDMALALAQLDAFGHDIPLVLRTEIKWLLDRVEGLEQDRNNLAHSPFFEAQGRISTLHLGQHKRGLEIENRDPVAYCRWFYDTAVCLRDYAGCLEDAIRQQQQTAPPRPKLPTRT